MRLIGYGIRRRKAINRFETRLRKLAKAGKVAEVLDILRTDFRRLGGCKDTLKLIDCCENIAENQPNFGEWCVEVALWARELIKQRKKGEI